MKVRYIAGAAIFSACALLIVAFAPFASSAGKTSPAVPAAEAAATANADAPRDFDDWRLVCETPAAGKKQCQVFQRILWGKDKTQTIVLTTVLHPAQLKDKPATGMRLITPLGIVLTPGMAIKIDDGKDIKVPYTQCLPGGCLVDLIFDETMLGKIRNGKAMLVAYRLPNGKDNTLKVSLKGLAPALNAMTQTGSKG